MTYNVRYFGHGSRGLASSDRRIWHIAWRLANLDGGAPDVLCLQEIETRSFRADFGRRQGPDGSVRKPQFERFVEAFHRALQEVGSPVTYRAFYFPAHEYRLSKTSNLYTTGLGILARGELQVLLDNRDTPHDITHRRLASFARFKQTRIAAHVRIRHLNGKEIDLFNTHLSLPAFFTRDLWNYTKRLGFGKNQMEEARSLLDYIRSLENPGTPTIVCGDFNSLPGSPVHQYMLEQGGFCDAYREHHAIALTNGQEHPTAGVFGLRLPIDYMFSSHNVQWLDFDHTHSFGINGGQFHGLSDHVPLVARIRLP